MDQIRVTATGSLKEKLKDNATVAAGQTVGQAVESLRMNTSEAILAIVNRRLVSWDYVLAAGDELHLVPSVGGGI